MVALLVSPGLCASGAEVNKACAVALSDEEMLTQRKAVWAHLYSLTQNGHVAEELTQETWIRYIRQTEAAPVRKARAWLTRTALNVWKDFRKSPARKIIPTDLNYGTIRGDEPEPWERMAEEERDQILQEELHQLSPSDRDLLVAHHMMGISIPQIAETENANRDAIDMRLSRARARLRNRLQERAPSYFSNEN